MTRKFSFIFSIVSLCVFFLSVCYFVGILIIESGNGSKRAEEEYSKISREIIKTTSAYKFRDNDFTNYVDGLLRTTPYLAASTITGQNGIEYSYPPSSPYLIKDSNGSLRISAASPLLKIIREPLNIYDAHDVSLTIAMYTLPPSIIYYHGRNAFAIILIFTLLAIILIISLSIQTEPVNKNTNYTIKNTIPVPDVPLEQEIIFQSQGTIETTEEVTLQDAEPTIKFNQAQTAQVHHQEKEEDKQIKQQTDTVILPKQTDPTGLFSPSTGLGWESYLEVRLDAELSRSASSEEDMAFAIIEIPEIHREHAISKKIAEILIQYFKFRDLIFEYGKTGFAGILQNENLDNAMIIAEDIYNDIVSILHEYNISSKIAIGITTRVFRLIPGSRLIEEANQATAKAFEETNMPIVAFRANTEKYRDYIAEKMQKCNYSE